MDLVDFKIDANFSNLNDSQMEYEEVPSVLSDSTLAAVDRILKQFFGFIAFLINLLLFVMFAIKKKRMASEILICVNALLEMLICAVVLIKTQLSEYLLSLSDSALCSFELFPYTFLTTMSFLLVITISVNRYVAVKKSWKYQTWFSVPIVTRWLIIMTVMVLVHSTPELFLCYELSDWLAQVYPDYWLISRVVIVGVCWISLYAVYKGISNYFAHSFLAPLYNPKILHSDDAKSEPNPAEPMEPRGENAVNNCSFLGKGNQRETANAKSKSRRPTVITLAAMSEHRKTRHVSGTNEGMAGPALFMETRITEPNNNAMCKAELSNQEYFSPVDVHTENGVVKTGSNDAELQNQTREPLLASSQNANNASHIQICSTCLCEYRVGYKRCICTFMSEKKMFSEGQRMGLHEQTPPLSNKENIFNADSNEKMTELNFDHDKTYAQRQVEHRPSDGASSSLSFDSSVPKISLELPPDSNSPDRKFRSPYLRSPDATPVFVHGEVVGSYDDISEMSNRNASENNESDERNETELPNGTAHNGKVSRVAIQRMKMKKALKRRKLKNQKHKVTFSLFMVCLLYLVIVLPQLVLQVVNYIFSKDFVSPSDLLQIYTISETIYMLNFIINPLLYFYCSSYLCKQLDAIRNCFVGIFRKKADVKPSASKILEKNCNEC